MKERYFKCIGLKESNCTNWSDKINMGETYEGFVPLERHDVICIRFYNQTSLYVDADQFVEADGSGIDKSLYMPKPTKGYFKCVGTVEGSCSGWGEKVMLGRVYKGVMNHPLVKEGVLIIKMENNNSLPVDADQFVKIKDPEIDIRQVFSRIKRELDADPNMDEERVERIMSHLISKALGVKDPHAEEEKSVDKITLTEKLSDPNISKSEMNELLDELSKFK